MSEIEQVELSIAEAKKAVEKAKIARRLSTNPDFKKLILDGYFVEEAARLALLSGDPALPEEYRGHVMRDLHGPGALKRYLSTMVQMGDIAEKEIEEHQETLEELRDEGAE